jgi:hypothetical protein
VEIVCHGSVPLSVEIVCHVCLLDSRGVPGRSTESASRTTIAKIPSSE